MSFPPVLWMHRHVSPCHQADGKWGLLKNRPSQDITNALSRFSSLATVCLSWLNCDFCCFFFKCDNFAASFCIASILTATNGNNQNRFAAKTCIVVWQLLGCLQHVINLMFWFFLSFCLYLSFTGLCICPNLSPIYTANTVADVRWITFVFIRTVFYIAYSWLGLHCEQLWNVIWNQGFLLFKHRGNTQTMLVLSPVSVFETYLGLK